MARSSFQKRCLFSRGKTRKVWVARWREPVLGPEGTISRFIAQRSSDPYHSFPLDGKRRISWTQS